MNTSIPIQPLNIERLRMACSTCGLKELCLPVGLTDPELERVDELVHVRRTTKKGQSIYRSGETFDALFAVRSGFFKTTILSEDGRDQVTGFYMGGEIIGMDGISTDRHTCDAVALEDSEVCVIPFAHLEHLSREVPALQTHFHKVMSREIVRDHSVMMLLGSMRAEERLAAFLVNLSQRFVTRGYSPSEFYLRMTREEIGSYLGLKLETVSRVFSKFQEQGLISVQQKHVRIIDIPRLRQLIGQRPC